MSRIDPFVTYVGAAALVIGSIGLAFSADNTGTAGPTPHDAPVAALDGVAAQSWAPFEASPVAFYGETLELLKPPQAEPTHPAVLHHRVSESRMWSAEPVTDQVRARRPEAPARVIVRRGRERVDVFFVRRER